jgi:tRNA 5-methylaminomethyl-2-thiouridine biosynthesis bifunctional protein
MIKQAQLEWSDGIPVSTEFNDVYFHDTNGAMEARYVFLEGNNLESRWHAQSPNHFSIAETGFGTGLNFLCAWDLWLKNSQSSQHLHFLSVERFPLNKDCLIKALSLWPEFKLLTQILIEQYPPLINGWHTLHLPNPSELGGHVVLHLFFGDVHDWLPQIDGEIDAWFLDGFTPSRNPDMWNEAVFLQIAKLTPFNGTAATFTAASDIQRSFKAAGFKVSKRKGYGPKREMVMASQQFTNGPQRPKWLCDKPWLVNHAIRSSGERQPNTQSSEADKTVTIIGAGISGCTTAFSLAKRGWKVTVIDKNTMASGASGNAQGVVYAKLSAKMNLHSRFYLSGYLFSLINLKRQLPDKKNWDNCGVLQLATNDKEVKRQQRFCEEYSLDDVVIGVNRQQASDLAGIDIPYPGLFFKDGAWVYPQAWCKQLLNHQNITLLENTQAEKITQLDSDNRWLVELTSKADDIQSQVLVICNANDASLLDHLSFLPTKPVAGQVTQLPAQSLKLNTVLCGDHYVAPAHNGQLNFGASYRIKSDNTDVLESDNSANIDNLTSSFASIQDQLNLAVEPIGRASVRCTSPDYTPIAGPICDSQLFLEDFARLKKNRKWKFQQPAKFIEGLYINIAHGSRGLTSAPLCSELITAQITGEPLPMPKEQANMLNPNRFLVNEITKKD